MLFSTVVREVETNHTDCCLIELVVGRVGWVIVENLRAFVQKSCDEGSIEPY